MQRKKWTKNPDSTPELERTREKRRWQIALRRYVLEGNVSSFYAPYFGLDIKNLRKWFEYQFKDGIGWDDFASKWQFDHIIPVNYFEFTDELDLRLCWNFTNIRVEFNNRNREGGNRIDVLGAKRYFQELYNATQYKPCLQLLNKIDEIEVSELSSSQAQLDFVRQHREILEHVESYTAFEFELLNRGRSMEEVKKEIVFLKNLK
jgi:hypothetical protein